jgi:K+-sensing histidine kinase KdpD
MAAGQERHGVSLGWWQRRSSAGDPRAYVVAVLLVAAALLVRWILRGWFGNNVPYLQFFPAIMVAAWYGGFGPGVLATGLSALAATLFFLPPTARLVVASTPDVVSLGFFIAIGLGISWLNHKLRTAAVLSSSRAERLEPSSTRPSTAAS